MMNKQVGCRVSTVLGAVFLCFVGGQAAAVTPASSNDTDPYRVELMYEEGEPPLVFTRAEAAFLNYVKFLKGLGPTPTEDDAREWHAGLNMKKDFDLWRMILVLGGETVRTLSAQVNAYKENKTQFAPKDSMKPIGDCQSDFIGTFGVPDNPPFFHIVRYSREYLARSYAVGEPAFSIQREGNRLVKTGAISHTKKEVDVSEYVNTDGTGRFFKCSATLAPGVQLVTVDFNLTDDDIRADKYGVSSIFRKLTFSMEDIPRRIRDISDNRIKPDGFDVKGYVQPHRDAPKLIDPRADDINNVRYLMLITRDDAHQIHAVLPLWRRN